MIVRLHLSVIRHMDTGWTGIEASSDAADFRSDPIRISHEWHRQLELLPGEDAEAGARGALEWALSHHRGTIFRLVERGIVGPVA